MSNLKHAIVKRLKSIIYAGGEKYHFAGKDLLFMPNSRPVRRKYINSRSDVVRNDVLQIIYFENNFKPEHVIWDIGSHFGHYSIFAASIAGNENQVFSFEPDSSATIMQKQNIIINHFENKIKLYDYVISDKDGTIKFMDLSGNANSHIVKDSSLSDMNCVIKEAKSLDSLLSIIPEPNFIKIDTEGAEIDILRGGSNLLQNDKVQFICELHPFAWKDFGVSFDDITRILNKYGRKIRLLDDMRSENDLPYYGTVLF